MNVITQIPTALPLIPAMVETAEDWEFSSAADYSGLRNGTLINKKVAGEFVDTGF